MMVARSRKSAVLPVVLFDTPRLFPAGVFVRVLPPRPCALLLHVRTYHVRSLLELAVFPSCWFANSFQYLYLAYSDSMSFEDLPPHVHDRQLRLTMYAQPYRAAFYRIVPPSYSKTYRLSPRTGVPYAQPYEKQIR